LITSGGRKLHSARRLDFFRGGAEFFKFVVRVAAMDGPGFVAGEFHPQFRRNALIRQRACEKTAAGCRPLSTEVTATFSKGVLLPRLIATLEGLWDGQ